MQSLTDQITATLGGLGETSDDIANALRNKGIRGTRASADVCPLAYYLREQFPQQFQGIGFQVGCYQVTVYNQHGDMATAAILTEGQADFVRSFDNGNYPDLDLERQR